LLQRNYLAIAHNLDNSLYATTPIADTVITALLSEITFSSPLARDSLVDMQSRLHATRAVNHQLTNFRPGLTVLQLLHHADKQGVVLKVSGSVLMNQMTLPAIDSILPISIAAIINSFGACVSNQT
jgi:hypothetical protein